MHDLWLKHEQKLPQILVVILYFIPKNLNWYRYDETIGNELIKRMELCYSVKCETTSQRHIYSQFTFSDFIPSYIFRVNDMGISSVHQAVSANNLQCLSTLVKNGARVVCTDKRGLQPIDVAKVRHMNVTH